MRAEADSLTHPFDSPRTCQQSSKSAASRCCSLRPSPSSCSSSLLPFLSSNDGHLVPYPAQDRHSGFRRPSQPVHFPLPSTPTNARALLSSFLLRLPSSCNASPPAQHSLAAAPRPGWSVSSRSTASSPRALPTSVATRPSTASKTRGPSFLPPPLLPFNDLSSLARFLSFLDLA